LPGLYVHSFHVACAFPMFLQVRVLQQLALVRDRPNAALRHTSSATHASQVRHTVPDTPGTRTNKHFSRNTEPFAGMLGFYSMLRGILEVYGTNCWPTSISAVCNPFKVDRSSEITEFPMFLVPGASSWGHITVTTHVQD
jgi:hypothetical protein